ncbi:ROK family glucokinase [Demequina capsici]|uniref:Glucokinase n=1 Tax=Demequina capsici TaxID=3075620 RepID=A0AA96F693_9MICO|nr:ROK family glucokinase [Demequina sp. OYTSA14]WNM23582.1 ROK family glucokinase [Demequina sp. OYTSA14]
MGYEGLAVGVDIGGTNILAGLVDGEGNIVARARRVTDPADPTSIEAEVAAAVAELSERDEVVAVGVAAAGFVAPDSSTLLFAPNIAWRDHPLGARLTERIGLPVTVENDANAAAWAEFRFGNGRGRHDMVMLTLGTGLGGGIIAGGKLFRGGFGAAAELGHLTIVPDGHYCGCGREGCWEAYASGTALANLANSIATADPEAATVMSRLAEGGPIGGAHVTAAARQGDAVAVRLLRRFGYYLGRGIATLAAVIDPEAVIIGGGIATAAGDLIIPSAEDGFRANLSGQGIGGRLQIVTALLGNDAGMIGAADSARVASTSAVLSRA